MGNYYLRRFFDVEILQGEVVCPMRSVEVPINSPNTHRLQTKMFWNRILFHLSGGFESLMGCHSLK